jgi:TRAP-type C4-dicarboxylate transport system permease small subunit
MQGFLGVTKRFSNALNLVAAALLTTMMLLTTLDVILRYLGRPITGTYELMGYAGALVTGFALAQSTLDDAQVKVDILTGAVSAKTNKVLDIFTRMLGLGIFALLTWSLFLKGNDLYRTGEVSLTLRVPYFPVAYGLSLCCLVEFLVLLSQTLKALFGGKHE